MLHKQFARSKTEKRVFNQLKPFMGSVYMLQSGQNVESHIVGDSFPAYMASVERCGLFVFSNFFFEMMVDQIVGLDMFGLSLEQDGKHMKE